MMCLLECAQVADLINPDSNAGPLPFPRLSSTSSLMSLDNDTPVKAAPGSLRRRLASKSMHDLAGHGSFPSTPSRAISSGDSSPMSLTKEFGRRSEANTSPTKRSFPPSDVRDPPKSPSRAVSQQVHPPLPSRTQTAPGALPPSSSAPPLTPYDDDDVPSPFIKKMDGSRFPSASNLPTKAATVSGRPSAPLVGAAGRRQSMSAAKPSMSSRLLAARAGAISAADKLTGGHARGKSAAA